MRRDRLGKGGVVRFLAEPEPDDVQQLKALVSPDDASDAGLIWTSSDPTIAGVSETGEVTAPFNATVTSLMEDTRHAVGLTAEDGTEVLIHFGIDTVKLGGVGFTALVAQGDAVQAGQRLLQVDLAMIQDKVPSTISPIVFTNLPEGVGVKVEEGRTVKAGETGFFSVK